VFLDFRTNPDAFSFPSLSEEARNYLEKSQALLGTPIARLEKMNPGAVALYLDHGIDIRKEPLEIGVCAQHNNGGLAGNHWWESVNIRHLFPVGEVNGSHGVYRPGGSALNSGQVAGFRAAEYIANRYRQPTLDAGSVEQAAARAVAELRAWIGVAGGGQRSWQADRAELQERMSRAAAHIRERGEVEKAVGEAWRQHHRMEAAGGAGAGGTELVERLRNRQLSFAHVVYLEAVKFALETGVGSRGSALVLDGGGLHVHDRLGGEWRMLPENPVFREQVQETVADAAGRVTHRWTPRRPLPDIDTWFEAAWARFRSGEIYD
jgi:succinate dehydrogenase/fumarate reductase flavoprotein subunit